MIGLSEQDNRRTSLLASQVEMLLERNQQPAGVAQTPMPTWSRIKQNNTFVQGQAVYQKSDGTWDLLTTSTPPSGNAIWGVVRRSMPNSFTVTTSGRAIIALSGLTKGTVYAFIAGAYVASSGSGPYKAVAIDDKSVFIVQNVAAGSSGLTIPTDDMVYFLTSGAHVWTPVASGIAYVTLRAGGGGGSGSYHTIDYFASGFGNIYIIAGGAGGGQGGFLSAAIKINAGVAVTFTVGGGGAHGSTGSDGSAGGSTTLTHGSISLSVNGGVGGAAPSSATVGAAGVGGGYPSRQTITAGKAVLLAMVNGAQGQQGRMITTANTSFWSYGGRGGGDSAANSNGNGGNGETIQGTTVMAAATDGDVGFAGYAFAAA